MPAAQAVLAALATQLQATNAGLPTHLRITPGDAVIAALTNTVNEACEGIASVRTMRIFPTSHFPEEDNRAYTEGGPVTFAVEFEMLVLRCGAQPGPDLAPTDAQLMGDAQAEMDDANAMRRVGPELMRADVIYDYVLGAWEPLAAEGGAHGGVTTITVQVGCVDC